MHSLEIRFSYLCRRTHENENGQCPIVFRITFRGERRDIFTGIYINSENWRSNASPFGMVRRKEKDAASTNNNLLEIYRKAENIFDKLRFSGQDFSIDELVNKIKGKEKSPELLIDYIESAINFSARRVGVEITKATYYKYQRTLRNLVSYLEHEHKVKNFLLSKINPPFLQKFFHFLRTSCGLSNNTAVKTMVFLKTQLGEALREGIIKNDPFKGLRFKCIPTNPQYLTNEELEILHNIELGDTDMGRKRDIFLFSCYTGLAYIDLRKLEGKDLESDTDGTWFIRKTRQKTGEMSTIPLLPVALRLLKKYCSTDDVRSFKWQVSTNQKMNLGLKHIGRKAGISKILHMHMARHTFATTVTLSNGIPIESVSKMLGHANVRQTQHYAKIVARKVKYDMKQIEGLYQ